MSGAGNRSFIQRSFGKMEPGSLRGSILTLIITAIGGGTLSLPYAMVQSGCILGLILILLGAIAAIWSFDLIIQTLKRTGRITSVKEFCIKSGGPKLEIFYNVIVVLTLYGSICAFNIIVKTLLLDIIKLIWGPTNPNINLYSNLEVIIAIVVIVFPFSLFWTMNQLRYFAIVSFCAIIYVVIILIAETPAYFAKFNPWSHPEKGFHYHSFIFDFNILNSFAIGFYAFTCQTSFFPIFSELAIPNQRRAYKIVYRSMFVNWLFYTLIALAGYLSTFDQTPHVVLNRRPLSDDPNAHDYKLLVGSVAISFSLIFASPLNYNPFRTSLLNLIFPNNPKLTWPRVITISILFCSSIAFLVILFADYIINVIGIIGGIGCVAICFVIPVIAYISIYPEPEFKTKRIISICLGIILSIIGLGATVVSIIGML